MKLFLNGITRIEEGEKSSNLLRKGWKEVVDIAPSFNELTQTIKASEIKVENGVPVQVYTIESIPDADVRQRAFEKAVSEGFDTGMGFKLALYESDRNAFSQAVNLFNEGMSLGHITPNTIVKIKDKDGVFHEVTVSAFKSLAFMYGMYYTNLWVNK